MLNKQPLACAISSILLTASLPVFSQDDAQSKVQSRAELEEIIVTGSRIRKSGFSSASPMDVIDVAGASRQGISNLGSLLQSTTIARGSEQITSAMSTLYSANGGTGVQTVGLRGLGANRTLTLVNGRRAGPAGLGGSVSSFDLNVLPLSTIERVEILKDGASSIYGSDAVAGVINIITRKDDESSFNMFTSQPTKSGGETSNIDFSWGQTSGKFYSRVTGSYSRQSELKQGQRDYFSCGEEYIFDQETGERADLIDPRTGKPHCDDSRWGHVWVYDYVGDDEDATRAFLAQYDYDGDLGDYIPSYSDVTSDLSLENGAPSGFYPVDYDRTSDAVTNADNPFQDQTSFVPKQEVATFFAEATYDFTDDHQAYAELLLNRRETSVNAYRQLWTYIYNSDNGNESATAEGWSGDGWLSPLTITDQNDGDYRVDYHRAVLGMTGDINEDWMYDVSFQHSYSDGSYHEQQALKDAVDGNEWESANGDGTCAGTMLVRDYGPDVPCLDLPWTDPRFLRGDYTPEELAYLFAWETGTTRYTQQTLSGFASGPLLELPAGTLSAAFGIDYRTDKIKDTPGEITLNSNSWGSSAASITEGEDTTKAIFAELDIPLLKDLPMIEHLTMSLSGRYNRVESYGSGNTYKVGLDWGLTDTVRIRSGHGTSFRAPGLFELYLADQTSFEDQRDMDICSGWGAALRRGDITQRTADNCAAGRPDLGLAGVADNQNSNTTATVFTGGGKGYLKAETSRMNTLGIVWQPEFAELSISADYFDIEIDDEIDTLGAIAIVRRCYDSENFATNPLCRLFKRDPNGNFITDVQDRYLNIDKQINRGWDLELNYTTELPWGVLTIDTQHTFQIEDYVRDLSTEGAATDEDAGEDTNGELGDPKWVGDFTAGLERGNWLYEWDMEFVGAVSNYADWGSDTVTPYEQDYRAVLHIPTTMYHSFSVTHSSDESGMEITFGIRNAFDKEPPKVTTTADLDTLGRSAMYSQYYWRGRMLHLSLNKTF